MSDSMSVVMSIALVCALILAFVVANKWMDRKIERLFNNTWRDGMVAHSKCMIRDGLLECPGVAWVADDALFIVRVVFNKKREIPLSQVTVFREGPGTGKYGWWGKQVFYLNTPETSNLAIGVKDPLPWRKAFVHRP